MFLIHKEEEEVQDQLIGNLDELFKRKAWLGLRGAGRRCSRKVRFYLLWIWKIPFGGVLLAAFCGVCSCFLCSGIRRPSCEFGCLWFWIFWVLREWHGDSCWKYFWWVRSAVTHHLAVSCKRPLRKLANQHCMQAANNADHACRTSQTWRRSQKMDSRDMWQWVLTGTFLEWSNRIHGYITIFLNRFSFSCRCLQ